MQLPGFASEPVRASLDVTWWPSEDYFTTSVRLWVRSDESGTWQMEYMEANPQWFRHEVATKVRTWADHWARYIAELAEIDEDMKSRPW